MSMFRYLGEKIPVSDTDSDVYHICNHAYMNAKYIIITNDCANVRPVWTGIKRIDWSITEHVGWSTLTVRYNNVR